MILSCLLAGTLTTSCTGSQDRQGQNGETTADTTMSNTSFSDPHSYANPDEARIQHLDLELTVDFEQKRLLGKSIYTLETASDAEQFILDTRGLEIKSVTIDKSEEPAVWDLGEGNEMMGQPLTIRITSNVKKVTVEYVTGPEADALDWLEPRQTAGGKHPFLYTQSQAILARTWIPLQDGPGIRFTYNAQVTVPREMMAVMSAENPQEKTEDGIYNFEMSQPIPSYLMALAVGDLEFRPIGRRTGIYAEPSMADASVYEFADMEKMLESTEELYGPYRWERYDLIVLPPSFPFGGMENPRLTFATPTILAGDRSLTALVAHELAHSWSGNLVTNANWNDFWLNEGFTVYLERRIMEALYGREYSEMLALLGIQDLRSTVERLMGENPDDTRLKLDLEGRNPDDGLTDVAYEKGYFFLRMLEENTGREKFDNFLKKYFDKFAFEPMTTSYFLAYMKENLLNNDDTLYEQLQVGKWVYGRGLPDNIAEVESQRFAHVESQVEAWKEGEPAGNLDTSGWSSHEWLRFIRQLPHEMSEEQMAELDTSFGFTTSGNSEIQAAWYRTAIRNNYTAAYPALERFLTKIGRRKFLTPLYTEMVATPEGKQRALKIYNQARPSYHSVSTGTIDDVVEWERE